MIGLALVLAVLGIVTFVLSLAVHVAVRRVGELLAAFQAHEGGRPGRPKNGTGAGTNSQPHGRAA